MKKNAEQIRIRIAVLRARGKDNNKIINKLMRQLRQAEQSA